MATMATKSVTIIGKQCELSVIASYHVIHKEYGGKLVERKHKVLCFLTNFFLCTFDPLWAWTPDCLQVLHFQSQILAPSGVGSP